MKKDAHFVYPTLCQMFTQNECYLVEDALNEFMKAHPMDGKALEDVREAFMLAGRWQHHMGKTDRIDGDC